MNISKLLETSAQQHPHKIAVTDGFKRLNKKFVYSNTTYIQLYTLSNQYAFGLLEKDVKSDDKALIMMTPGVDFIAIAFALFRIGVIPVMIDPGIGLKRVLGCIAMTKPDLLVGDPEAIYFSKAYRRTFASVRQRFVTKGTISGLFATPFSDLIISCSEVPVMVDKKAEDLCAILFTTGSTGIPKGVEYTPRVILGQLEALRETYQLTEADIDMPIIPVFVIGTIAMGMRVVIPPIDPTQPIKANAQDVVDVINDNGVTFSFGSPAIWNKIAIYCAETKQQLNSIKHLLVAGAPTPASTLRALPSVIPNGQFYTPLGATEATPFTNISGAEIVGEVLNASENGHGFCVGRPITTHQVKVIKPSTSVISNWDQVEELPAGEVGEIIVSGPVVTHRYFLLPEETKKAKINEAGKIWHRLGDVGYLDRNQRLWFCGRKSHVAYFKNDPYYTVQVEGLFNKLPEIWRTALVNVTHHDELALCIELQQQGSRQQNAKIFEEIEGKLKTIAKENNLPIKFFLVYKGSFPVDRRHNAKIEREQISKWASELLSKKPTG